jgi:hypothetical protein
MSPYVIKTVLVMTACSAAFACGFEAEPGQQPLPSPGGSATAGTTNAAAGTPATGGTFGTAGDTAVAGSFGTAGSGGETGGGGAGGATAAGSGGSATAGTGGTGVVVPVMCPAQPAGDPAPLPLSIATPNFAPSGHFAGPMDNLAGILVAQCAERPAEHTIGECFDSTFTPALAGYAGVFWQFGAQNWGASPGMKVAPGATKVTFKAWSASEAGGESVRFSAGGIADPTLPCADTVNLGQAGGTPVVLTTTPTDYEIDLMGQTYPDGIIGGFMWVVEVTEVTVPAVPIHFYVDEIQWVQ